MRVMIEDLENREMCKIKPPNCDNTLMLVRFLPVFFSVPTHTHTHTCMGMHAHTPARSLLKFCEPVLSLISIRASSLGSVNHSHSKSLIFRRKSMFHRPGRFQRALRKAAQVGRAVGSSRTWWVCLGRCRALLAFPLSRCEEPPAHGVTGCLLIEDSVTFP